ncbi:S-adenosyl-L-methionine-dependent methyltransferase [Aspergillus sclerotioniger CBS 115572]|uniref:S-adenosyl-L-methionine-dependent methyltransferase n=1 Tax=Aspergillus sclerotioniger CBS 115572 TaxID=1450535 RepID=A0A317W4G5_9EURO|nr:S-adenosyl-L-methionine-dependent methyltransferase [Aspergillus sclerotioniger CBS 115572]PWY81506.1 S-adenosyl-L-methionine-dependent methyltransferase [Aspergillus sclerotioniger CBS 115572]
MANDTYLSSMLQTYSVRTAVNTSAYFIPRIQPHMKILDIGCGPGSITLDLAALVPQGSVIGIDCSETAINSANDLTRKRGTENASFQVASVLDLPFEDGTFDIVCAHQVLIHLPNESGRTGAVEGLKEMRRVCKPGGLVCARECDWRSAVIHPSIPGVLDSMKLVEQLTALKGTSPYGGLARSWAEGAGFHASDVEASAAAVYYSRPEEVNWWGETMAQRLEQGSSLDVGIKEGFITESQREQLPVAWREWAQQSDALFSMTDIQVICKK